MSKSWSHDCQLWISIVLFTFFTLVHCERIVDSYPHKIVIEDPYTESQLPLESRIRKKGYPVEIHTVNTKDGYILSLYRVLHGPNEKNTGNKSVVLLCHGGHSAAVLKNYSRTELDVNNFISYHSNQSHKMFRRNMQKYGKEPDTGMGGTPPMFWIYEKFSLGYYFVDRGYDVWTLCARGVHCAHQKKHVKYDWDKDTKYWDFSMHEIGVYDLSAHIDYVLNYTGQEKLFLAGHSAGNAVMFILLSDRPEYNDKVKMAVSHAPSIILKNIDYPLIEFVAAMVKILKGLYKILGLVEFIPTADKFKPFFLTACRDPDYIPVCVHVMSIVGSHMSVLANAQELLPFLVQDAGYRSSARQIFHYLECIDDGLFRKYDYGPKKNSRLYGQTTPPNYNLSAVVVPTAFIYGSGDSICTEEDVKVSMDQIPNVVMEHRVPFKKFTHTDFIFAKEAAEWVYEPTFRLFKDYDEGILPPKRKRRLDIKNEL